MECAMKNILRKIKYQFPRLSRSLAYMEDADRESRVIMCQWFVLTEEHINSNASKLMVVFDCALAPCDVADITKIITTEVHADRLSVGADFFMDPKSSKISYGSDAHIDHFNQLMTQMGIERCIVCETFFPRELLMGHKCVKCMDEAITLN